MLPSLSPSREYTAVPSTLSDEIRSAVSSLEIVSRSVSSAMAPSPTHRWNGSNRSGRLMFRLLPDDEPARGKFALDHEYGRRGADAPSARASPPRRAGAGVGRG